MQLWQDWLTRRFQFKGQKTFTQKDVLIFLYKQGFVYIFLIFITFIAGINYANNLILGFCFLISAILCISFYLTFKQLHGLTISIHVDELGQVGQPLHMHLNIQQNHVQQRFLYVRTDAGEQHFKLTQKQQHFVVQFFPEQRGQYCYPMLQIYSVYPFGLVRAWSYIYHQYFAWVAPISKAYPTEMRGLAELLNDQDFDEFRELRHYQQGDSMQAISWKQAARGQGLYLKVFEQQQQERHISIQYSHMPAASHEEKLSYMMGMLEQAEQLQCTYCLLLPTTELEVGSGPKQFQKAQRLLAQA